MRKFLNGYVNQQRFFKKRTDHRSEGHEIPLAKLPPILVKLQTKIENVNFKYKSNPGVIKRRNRKASLPTLKYSNDENQV